MKFQCVLCQSTYTVKPTQFGDAIECPNCLKKIVVPKKPYDRSRIVGGDFAIDRVIGTGGMGTVYLAHQISLERNVALKVLAKKFSVDPKFRLEFQREARAASRLTHSNLVQAYAFGEDEGDLFLAMEYVEGTTMGDRLDNETRLMIDEALNIVQQVAEGLHFAWTEEQLIHRDIKPDNIMLTPDGHVKLTDMGLARTAVELETVTEVSGTPAYMNPEQFTKQAMDCRADIYSLGVCLYHGTTGQLPFDSPNVRELARQHIQDKVQFPDKVVDLPPELKKLLRKMMNKNREDRQIDHEALLHDIYTTRIKINGSSKNIPNVHTLSFSRYEFKNLSPQRKRKHDTQVNSTKQLPRKKIKPLSSSTSHLTTSFTTDSDAPTNDSFFLNNLVAIIALIAALIVGFTLRGDSESFFYRQATNYISSLSADADPAKVIERIDVLLEKDKNDSPNKKDYYAHNLLLKTKLKCLQQLNEINNKKVEEKEATIKKLEVESRELSAKKTKLRQEYDEKITDLSNKLATQRQWFEELKSQQKQSPENRNSAFSKAISEDIKILEQLWTEKKSKIRFAILKELNIYEYADATKIVTDLKTNYTGIYKEWLEKQQSFIDDARKVWESVELNLPELVATDLTINGETISVFRVYESSQEIESQEGEIIKLEDISVKELLDIYAKICEKTGKKPINGAAYAVSMLDFNYASTISPDDDRIGNYAQTYVDERLLPYINKQLNSGDHEKAEELAKKMFERSDKVINVKLFKERIEKIFSRNIFDLEPQLKEN